MNQNTPKKLRAKEKLARIPIKIIPTDNPIPKPNWIKIKLPNSDKAQKLKEMLNSKKLVTVCEEATCPNLSECYTKGTATFMIMGELCTRRCSFCDVANGKPKPLNPDEPKELALAVKQMQLKYVVITSVDRDDLKDGGAQHFVDCIEYTRKINPNIKIEILVPDFRGRMDKALDILANNPPDIFNHNIETVPRLYKQARPGSDYQWSLKLLKRHKENFRNIPTKSGIMVGLGETKQEIIQVLEDLRNHNVNMVTIGQYLSPSKYHMPVARYMPPSEFKELEILCQKLGFSHVASGPLVRSSYHADKQASGEHVS
ncbi:MAG: lipoyl synthase [Legionellales bacterium]|nr:lipoyl synthase [Legionellales bacterium]